MKQYLSTVLVLVSILLAVALVMTKRSDHAELDTAAATLTDFSNQLDTAQAQIVIRNGDLLTLSNRFVECTSTTLTLSNQLSEAQSTIALHTEQLINLNRRIATAASENETLNQGLLDLTNQMTALKEQTARTEASLIRTNQDLVQMQKDYGVLSGRLRQDVAERLILERKFRSPSAMQGQIEFLKYSPEEIMTAERIYAGLNVEVRSNGTVRVLSPD